MQEKNVQEEKMDCKKAVEWLVANGFGCDSFNGNRFSKELFPGMSVMIVIPFIKGEPCRAYACSVHDGLPGCNPYMQGLSCGFGETPMAAYRDLPEKTDAFTGRMLDCMRHDIEEAV